MSSFKSFINIYECTYVAKNFYNRFIVYLFFVSHRYIFFTIIKTMFAIHNHTKDIRALISLIIPTTLDNNYGENLKRYFSCRHKQYKTLLNDNLVRFKIISLYL